MIRAGKGANTGKPNYRAKTGEDLSGRGINKRSQSQHF
jgi:hypothetical protein